MTAQPERLRVALLRGIPEFVGPSVRQFADALEEGFRSQGEIALQPQVLHELGLVRRLSHGAPHRLAVGAENVIDSFVRYPLSIRRAARGQDMTIFHIIDQWYGHLAACLPRRRTIVSCQDLILAKYPELGTEHRPTRRDSVRYAASVHLMDRVARVVCSTQAVKADLVRLRGVSPERVSVVAKGVAPQMRPLGRSSEDLRRTVPGARGAIVLHVSTGWPYKNVASTLRVLAALHQRGLAATLLRVGVPLTAGERAHAARLQIAPWIIELGTVDQQRLVEVYNLADVLLFPSLDEGFGRPPVEAMACGTPVVTSTAPALVEVVGDAALCADATDIAGLARAVEAVLSEPVLAAGLRARGLERARRYTWGATVDAYATLYRDLARSVHRRPGRGERG